MCLMHDFACSVIYVLHQTAKGRTNVELREQFILAEGVSQSMTPFVSKARSQQTSPTQVSTRTTTTSVVELPTSGPVTKVCFN